MKNFEKYIDKGILQHCRIHELRTKQLVCPTFESELGSISCTKCVIENNRWLNEEYVEPIHLTHDEYVILKNLPKECKYITRDESGDVESYEYKPTKETHMWFASESFVGELYVFNHLFQFIKWEDEPYEIAKLIADYERENGNEKD